MTILSPDIYKAYRADDGVLDRNVFPRIITEFNRKLSKAVIEEGLRFSIPGFGILRITRKKRRGTISINYNETRKRKKEIIDNGRTPFVVLERDKEGKITKTNGGEEYLVTQQDSHYFSWSIGNVTLVTFNNNTYKFLPCRANKENLSHYLKDNPLVELNYIK
ncbi:hypothetical protein LCGC14_0246450 [marine sediment metagenome]|uniref:Uncharacterized protein n=1 Tax=marine sediment metagenome TaxID=412755 RepID=A0A0F9UAT1_9ZZZZ